MPYKVSATMHGRRIKTDKIFLTKKDALKYARETNKYRPGARARVVKAK